MMRKFSVLAAMCFFVCRAQSNAQGTTGSIWGTVKDQQGAVVVGATVGAVNEETGMMRTAVADLAGRYAMLSLSPGNYRVSASQPGFQTVARTGIVLTVAREAVVDFELPRGDSSQTVEGAGDAPPVNSTNSMQASLMDRRSIGELPRGYGNYTGLVLFEPGVTSYAPAAGSSFEFSAGQRFSATGGRGYTNSFLLDGTDINDHANGTPGNASFRNPGIESVREFAVLTEGYKAEYGRASGGIVAAVTRSGTNQFHGSAYEFHSNSAINARNFFDFRTPPYRANRFGASLGGPVRRDQTFFFANYEGWREGLGIRSGAVVPDQNARRGLLPGPGGQLQPAPGLQSGMLPFLALYPAPNGPELLSANGLPSGVARVLNSSTRTTNGDYGVVRLDHPISEKIQLVGRYAVDDDSTVSPQLAPVFNDVLSARRQYSTIQLTETLRPTLINSFRFAYNRTAQHLDSVPAVPIPANLTFVSGQPLGTITVGGLAPLGSSTVAPRQWVFNLFQAGDDLSYIRGMHALKVGVNIERIQDNTAQNTLVRGAATFPSLLALLQDRPTFFQFGTPAYPGFRQSLFAAYGQDDIRLSGHLTLNLGLHWEAVTDPTEAHGRISNIISPPFGPVQVLNKYFEVSKKNFEPRAGLAWQFSGKTVLRAGSGIYYDQLLPFIYARDSAQMPPFFGTATFVSVPLLTLTPIPPGIQPPPACGPSAPPPPACSIFSLTTMSWKNQTPTKYEYDVSVEQQLFKGTVLELAYVGSAARHLWRQAERNGPAAQVCSDPAGCISGGVLPLVGRTIVPQGTTYVPPGGRPNPYLGFVRVRETDSNSNYNSLQVSVRHGSTSGLQFQASYAFSRAIDENSSVFTGDIASETFTTLNPQDRRRDRGLSAFHAQHHSVFYASYPFPFRSDNKVLGQVIEGWKVNAVGTFSSGRPFTPLVGFNVSGNGDTGMPDRSRLNPNFRGSVILGVDGVRKTGSYFDPRAYLLPLPGTFGNVGRNTLLGPGLADLDASVEKGFRVRENLNVRFRAEFYNALNHTNFGLPIASVFTPSGFFNPAAGLIVNTVTTSRQIQFGLSVNF